MTMEFSQTCEEYEEEKKLQSFSIILEKGSNWTYIRRSENVPDIFLRDHSFRVYAKLSEKTIFLTPWYAHVRVLISA